MDKDVREMLNAPTPLVPAIIFVPVVVSVIGVVLYIRPLLNTDAPPSKVMLPPLIADVRVIDVAGEVVMVGSDGGIGAKVLKFNSLPKPTPKPLTTYALM